jgi:hypothetical protein
MLLTRHPLKPFFLSSATKFLLADVLCWEIERASAMTVWPFAPDVLGQCGDRATQDGSLIELVPIADKNTINMQRPSNPSYVSSLRTS